MGFKQHEACPNCGSKDNLARYDDGGAFCFGCHYREARTHAPMRNMSTEGDDKYHHPMPDDCGTHFGQAAVAWLASFHLDVPTAIRHGVVWSPSREQLIYTLGNCWQARNFGQGGGNQGRPRSKNFTSGDVNECLHIYSNVSGRSSSAEGERETLAGEGLEPTLVIVEDPVSAIRIASAGGTFDSMPLLGSHLASSRLNAVAGLYDDLVFWLDSDKYKEARGMCDKAKYMGLSARTIFTELDPKCYTNSQINEILVDSI